MPFFTLVVTLAGEASLNLSLHPCFNLFWAHYLAIAGCITVRSCFMLFSLLIFAALYISIVLLLIALSVAPFS